MNKFLLRSGLLALTLLIPNLVHAQDMGQRHPQLEDDFIFAAGAFLPNKTLKIRVDGSVPEQGVDFDEVVDLSSDQSTANASLRWRFGEKWSISGQYFKTDDAGSAELVEELHWEDYVLRVGSNVGAGVGSKVARLFFGREMSAGPRHELGLGAGLHWLEISAFVEGEFFINDESTGFRRESVSADAPLPNIGAWYWYALSPRWLITTRVDWLAASIGDYSGSLWNANAGINFQPWRNVGIGLSYQLFELDIDVDKSDWHGGADLTYHGPFLGLNVNW
jgi:hypothetical protein